MRAPWKAVLIGGEITVLAAFTGIGLHLAMQPHRHALLAPPALLLPIAPPPAVLPTAAAPAPARVASTPPSARLSGDWVTQLGRHDRGLVKSQWDILEGLIGGVERYLRERVVPQLEQRG